MTAIQPASEYLTACGHEIHYMHWSPDRSDPIVMWHGLARTGRDFDPCARRFADRFRIVAPDTIGRGLSGWSAAPEAEYRLEHYADIAVEMLDRLGIERMRWVGTSMGGAIGMVLAAGPLKGRITHLVLNDIGPALAPAAINRIRSYVTQPPVFDTVLELETYLRTIYAPYGAISDDQWRQMAETSTRRRDDGKVTVHYDPAVMRVFAETTGDFEMWDAWDAIEAKTLVLRGETSDLLTQDTAEEMTRRGPKASLAVIPGCGHAPALNVPDQLDLLDRFLAS
ncbi:alpha/beta hydrolase [Tistrella bauzanensis]|uniref:alpha/beta fold hydrolase n=1 Tax=Tistrella TaxID=171436 RepID=UPI0031F705BE